MAEVKVNPPCSRTVVIVYPEKTFTINCKDDKEGKEVWSSLLARWQGGIFQRVMQFDKNEVSGSGKEFLKLCDMVGGADGQKTSALLMRTGGTSFTTVFKINGGEDKNITSSSKEQHDNVGCELIRLWDTEILQNVLKKEFELSGKDFLTFTSIIRE
jgi:hypothetical protein